MNSITYKGVLNVCAKANYSSGMWSIACQVMIFNSYHTCQ